MIQRYLLERLAADANASPPTQAPMQPPTQESGETRQLPPIDLNGD